MAWVKLRAGARADAEDARRGLPRPDRDATRSRATGSLVDDFPMTVTGKIQKFRMRELAALCPPSNPRRDRVGGMR